MHPLVRSVAKRFVGTINKPVALARFRVSAARAVRPISLELGGRTRRDGWLVTDVGPRARNYLDATKRWGFEDDSLDLVYADNVLEHLSLDGGRALLREAHRCLRPGGRVRVVTPDVRRHVEAYLAGPDAVHGKVATRYRDMGIVVEHPVDLVRTPIGEFGHHLGYAYDFDALSQELARAGFSDIRELPVGESEDPRLRGLEARFDEGQAQVVVEGTRQP